MHAPPISGGAARDPAGAGGGAGPAPAAAAPFAVAHGTLDSSDIPGAAPRRVLRPPRSAPQLPADPGMQPQRLTRQRNEPRDLQLNVADIPGASPGGHSDWPRPRSHPLDPLNPQYRYLPPRPPEAPLPPPAFIRNTLDVSDIEGAKPQSPAGRTRHSQPSTLDSSDIEGASAGWCPRTLFAGQARDLMRVADISGARPQAKDKHLQLAASGGSGSSGAAEPHGSGGPWQRSPSPYGASLAGGGGWPHAAAPGVGVAVTPDWHKRVQQAKVQQAEVARQARHAADAAIGAAATKAAASRSQSPSPHPAGSCGSGSRGEAAAAGLAGMLQSLKAFDRDRSGRVQAGEFACVLQRGGLGLSLSEVQHLTASVQDSHSCVEYRPFVSKLWGKLQAATAAAQGPAPGGGATGSAPAASSPTSQLLPQFIAARQRRLQTSVGVVLGQQPEALAREAAEVVGLPGYQPWKEPALRAFGKRMEGYPHPAEFESCYSFCDGDSRSAQAAQKWKLSKDHQAAWGMRRRGGPAEQAQHGGAASSTLPPTSPGAHTAGAQRRHQQQQQQQRLATPAAGNHAGASAAEAASSQAAASQAAQGPARGTRSAPPTASYMRRDSPLLAAERAARAAAQQDVELLRSLQ